jgi:hypothetical protein
VRVGDGEAAEREAMARAVVSVGDVDTAYRRAGYGPPVIVLGIGVEAGERLPERLVPLIARCRVIVPEHASIGALLLPSGARATPFSSWFHGFLEGLGIVGVRVVAAAGFEPVLGRYAAAHPGELERLVLVGAAHGATDGAPETAANGTVVWRTAADVPWTAIAHFVSDGWPPPRPNAG